jgi:hypothetical protein
MARFNEILAGRFNRALQKFTGIKGPASTPQLGTEIIPSITLFWGSENRYLEGWQRFGTYQTVAALAANFSALQIRNPPNSANVIVLEKITVENTGAAANEFRLNFGVLAAANDLTAVPAGTVVRFDARGAPQSPTTVTSGTATSIPTNPICAAVILPNTTWDYIGTDIQELTVLPGDGVTLHGPINYIFAGAMWWRERPLEESERF